MALSISKALNIQQHEKSLVFLLLAQSVFLGIFAGALDVGANSLFLEAYSADMMPQAFMISGVVGILFTSVYTRMQKRMGFRLFTVLNLLIVILFSVALRFGYGVTDQPWLSFALLVMMGPLIIVSMLGFWGTAGRYFSLRDGKRLFGIIDTGSVVGMILAFYAVPLLVRGNFNVYDTLSIGIASLLLALLFQLLVLGRHKLSVNEQRDEEKEEEAKESGFLSIFRKRYTRMMALFVMLSVVTGFFVHYTFMWATEANYPDARELSGFLGAFFGTMMIVTIVIKSTLYSWLMKNFGLRVTLVISPVLLLVLTLVAAVVGSFSDFALEAGVSTFFFLLMVLSKLFNRSLKDAIESPSMKILYQSLDAEERFDVQARIDGIVNELTAFSTGVIMAGLLMLSFIEVTHFLYLLIIILGAWTFLGVYLYRAYRRTLNDTLAATKVVYVDREEEKSLKVELRSIIQEYRNKEIGVKDLQKAFRSKRKEEKIAALIEAVERQDIEQLPNFITLLRDREMEVRYACIEAAGMLKMKELGAYLVDYLGDGELHDVCWASLVNIGEDSLDHLESAFHKTGVSAEVQFRIVEAISEIGGKRANDLLFAKINYHQRKVRETVVKGLNRNKFEAKEAQMPLLQDLIYELCYAGAWNVAGLYTLQDLTEYDYLRRALEEEKLRNDELLFEVLGLAYDRSAVAHVQDSFMDPEIEDTGFALELLNLIVDEQVVLYLEPYFDELPIPDKIRKLQSEMPVDILKIEDLLLATISRDAMYAGNYLKLCAIEVIRDMEELDAGKYLAAQVFHSNFAISRFSASVLEDRDEAFYKELVLRKPELFQEKNIDGRKLIGLVERMGEWVSLKPQRMEYLFERIGAMLVEDEIDLEDEELVVRNLEKQRI